MRETALVQHPNVDPTRLGDWIQTRSGVKFYILDPRPEDFRVEDIAHALSLTCRFAGHVREFYCPTPDQRVLTSDLRWAPAGDLKVGDELIGFDETPIELGAAGKKRRRFRPSVVTAAQMVKRRIVRLEMSDGSTVRASEEHPWLVATKLSRNQAWLTSSQIALDLSMRRKRYMHRFFDTWESPCTWKAGWLAGIYDGEGYLSFGNKKGVSLGVSQNPGLVLDAIREAASSLGFDCCSERHTGSSGSVISLQHPGGWRDAARLLGTIRPMRLIEKFRSGLMDGTFAKQMNGKGTPLEIVAAYEEGEGWVSGLETSTHTYFCEGYGAHNSVAEHSVRVAWVLNAHPRRVQLTGLMHDATEAYISDMARPFKRLAEFEGYRDVEGKLAEHIAKRFGLIHPLPGPVKLADELLLGTEARDLMAPVVDNWHLRYTHLTETITPWAPSKAKREFLELFDSLQGDPS